MDQQPQESTSDLEASAGEERPPQEPRARSPRRRRLILVLSALAIVLLVGVSLGSYLVITHTQHPHEPTIGARLTPTATKTLAERWQVVDSLPVGKDSTMLSGITASSPTDAWAWGATTTSTGGPLGDKTPLLLHWDGQGWQTVAIPPDPHLTPLEITGITALSPPQFCGLEDITALSPTDLWAVGWQEAPGAAIGFGAGGGVQTLVLHWNGQQWSVVPVPNPGATRWLFQMTALSATDIWAIGGLQQSVPAGGFVEPPGQANPSTPTYTLIEHWDGQQWSVVPSPSPGTKANTLFGITALASNDVWVVGQDGSTDVAGPHGGKIVIEQPLTMHWDGQQWSVVSSPTLPGQPQSSALQAVVALGPGDIWAVGSITDMVQLVSPPFPRVFIQTTPIQASQMLMEHWDGQQWSIVAVSAPGQGSALYGLARVPTTSQLWAVGGWSQLSDLTTPTTTLTLLMD